MRLNHLKILSAMMIVFSILGASVVKVKAETPVSGAITVNTNWTAAASPYYVTGRITVNAGVTLTIEPGTVVKFAQNVLIDVNGTLNAVGASGSRIYFTDYRDDTTPDGDTNGDGSTTSPAAGWWRGVNVQDGGSAALDYCTVRYSYGANGGEWDNRNYGGVYKTGSGSLTLTNSAVSNSLYVGVWLVNTTGTDTVSGNIISNNGADGIYCNNSSPTIQNNTFTGNARYGLYITGTAVPASVTLNTFGSNTTGPIGIAANSSGAPIAADNILNGPLYIEGGAITANATWTNQVYYVTGRITVNAGVTLTIQPGTVVKFAQHVLIDVNGTLNAVGASGSWIYFTDYRDDTTPDGDTNGDGSTTSPAAGWWRGVNVQDGGSAALDYCTVRYSYGANGGEWDNRNYGGVYKTGSGSLTLTNSAVSNSLYVGVWLVNTTGTDTVSGNIISNNGADGIYCNNSNGVTISGNSISGNGNGISLSGASTTPLVKNNRIYSNNVGILCNSSANPVIGGTLVNGNDIYNNTSYGVLNGTDAVTVNATYNWWGSATGPTHSSNPSGNGDKVSDYVDFSNFLHYWATYIYTLDLDLAGSGGGYVTVPALSLTCNADCTSPVHRGEILTLQAQSAVDAVLSSWSGGGCIGTGECVFTMENDTLVTVTFTAVPPTADFSGTPLSGVEPLIVSFTDLSTHGPLSWLWSFGDSGSSARQNPGYDYTDPGTYSVVLTATNANGFDTETKTGYITVTACPNGPASISPTFYDTLQAAYDNAGNGAIIGGRYKTLGSMNLNKGTNVTIKGGYDCPHEAVVGITTITGSMKITTGSAVVENIAIK